MITKAMSAAGFMLALIGLLVIGQVVEAVARRFYGDEREDFFA